MHFIRRTGPLAAALAAATLVACAYAPRLSEETDNVLLIRNDYLATNPDGRFNDTIRRGEVARGMNFVEVLAAWGTPELRARDREKEMESWAYLSRDEISHDWTLVTFTFENGALTEWDASRHVSGGQAVVQWESGTQTLPPSTGTPGFWTGNDSARR